MKIEVVRSLPETNWRRFVEQNPRGNIFHTPEMFQVFQRARGHQPGLWSAVDHDGKVLALLLPVNIELGRRLPRFLTTRAVSYGGVLCEPTLTGEEGLAILLNHYSRKVDRNVLFTELRNISDLSGIQTTLNNSGFVYEDHLNYLIDLNRPFEKMIEGMGRKTRSQLRRALRKGEVMIEEAARSDQVAQCYEMLKLTYANARVPLADRSLFEAAFDVLYPLGMVKFLMAYVEGVCAAVSVELIYKDMVYAWYGGLDRKYASSYANELLTLHMFRWGNENGFRIYDFGGAGKPDEPYGVRDYKAKFRGELVCYGRNIYSHAPWRLAISKVGYKIYRRRLS